MLTKDDLHAYQNFCVQFLIQTAYCGLFLDCGLGKTVTTLTAINTLMYELFEINKVIVICPIRVGAVWKKEAESWSHLLGLRVSVAIGSAKERLKALQEEADIYVINRENVPWLIESSGLPFDYDMAVLDELSSFKNWQAKRVKSFLKVRPGLKRVIGLTGTPSPNGLMDLFAEMKCIDLGERLGKSIGFYRLDYFKPDKMNGPIVYSYKPLPGAEDRIYEKISDITISMRAADHLKMPKLITSEYRVCLSDKERKLYDSMCEDLVINLSDHEITAANAAALSNKLSQMANGAVYNDDGTVVEIHNRKLDALEDIVESMNGQPLLLTYWFRHDYDRIVKRLDSLGIKHEKLDSDAAIDRWNNREIPVALINPSAVGHGVNLQKGGHTICWFSSVWSLELTTQTIDRLYRQGQASGTVIVQHIIADGTIDEKIMKALSKKETTQDALIDAVKACI